MLVGRRQSPSPTLSAISRALASVSMGMHLMPSLPLVLRYLFDCSSRSIYALGALD